jgi:hypothetical protein
MKSIINSLVLSLLLANTQCIQINKERVSAESKSIINNAVNDVLKITQGPEAGDVIHSTAHHVHSVEKPTVVY